MNTSECFAFIETQFDHLFTTDRENNTITLRPGFGNIPPFTLVCVEVGDFLMGENGIKNDEKPPHSVNVNSFFMSEYLVTQEFYLSVTGRNPSSFDGLNHPVEQVDWYNATEFCNLLNKLLNLPMPYSGIGADTKCNFQFTAFRLPTEAEWEYAARGGKTAIIQTEYAGSNNVNNVAWYDKNNGHETKPVGLKFPNRLGLYDMSGNVWEWCWDLYSKNYYKGSPADNPKGPSDGSRRILRGGSWYSFDNNGRVVYRNYDTPIFNWHDSGFRILLALEFASGLGKAV